MILPGFGNAMASTEEEWEFASANTQYLTHGLFPYPARMIPQIAERLISLYWPNKELQSGVVVDVFCGSGTVLVEASLRGIRSVGTDINPFAVILTKAKTTAINEQELATTKSRLREDLKKFDGDAVDQYIPRFHNLNHWFKPHVVARLSHLSRAVDSIDDHNVCCIFKIALAHAIMKCSNVDWKSSRYLRILPDFKLSTHNPDVFTIFWGSLGDMEKRLIAYSARKKAETDVRREDARSLPFSDSEVDLIVTSPPYGEERNTIPYIRWSRLFLLWLGLSQKEVTDLEPMSLGGADTEFISQNDVPSNTFWQVASRVHANRLREALPFMVDYLTCLKEMRRVLRPGCKACIVIGHRSISRLLLDMGKVTKELGEAAGLKYETSHYRRIPKKMIPWTGPTGETIAEESIVVFSK